MIPSGKPTTNQPAKQSPKPIEPKIEKMEKVEHKSYYFIVYRQLKTDPWIHKGLGMEFFHDPEYARNQIPPTATEAYVVPITLPI